MSKRHVHSKHRTVESQHSHHVLPKLVCERFGGEQCNLVGDNELRQGLDSTDLSTAWACGGHVPPSGASPDEMGALHSSADRWKLLWRTPVRCLGRNGRDSLSLSLKFRTRLLDVCRGRLKVIDNQRSSKC